MPPSHPPPASLNTMRVESILFHAATRSRNVKNIPNAIPLGMIILELDIDVHFMAACVHTANTILGGGVLHWDPSGSYRSRTSAFGVTV